MFLSVELDFGRPILSTVLFPCQDFSVPLVDGEMAFADPPGRPIPRARAREMDRPASGLGAVDAMLTV